MNSRIIISLVLAVSAGAAAEPQKDAGRVALEQWFAAAAKAKTVQADFEQVRQLKSVRRPLRKAGKLWMDKRGGLFRWQVGDAPDLLALRAKDGSMTVLNAKDKLARVWSKEALEAEEKQGRGQGFAMLDAMQNATLADFDRDFELAKAKQDEANPALWHFDWKFRDGKIGLFVLRLAIIANTADGSMRSFTLHMRDGSSLSTVVRSYTLNTPIHADTFKVDTTGYQVEAMAPKP